MAGAEGLEFALQKHSRTARLERFALLLVFSPQRLAFFCHRQRQDASPRHTPRASESTKPPALYKRNNLRLAEVISLAGAEGLEFALQKHSRTARLERFALLLVFSPQRLAFFCHRQRQDASPRHTPRASESTKPPALYKRNNLRLAEVISLAGAEGLEPSARGFGDRCSTN